MRIMHDSVTAADIPANAGIVGGYVNGTYAWSAADWARFPAAIKVRIATRGYIDDGHVLDVETGAAAPTDAPGWVKMRRAAGVDPTVYCSASQLGTVQASFTAAGVPQPHYWVAHYDNVATVPSGCVAKQYIDPPTSGGHYDLSAVADYWPGVDKNQEDDLTPDESNRLHWLEQAVRTLVNQVTGDPKGDPSFDANMAWQDGHLPGFPNGDGTKHFTLTDFARQADWNSFQAHSNTDKIAATVAALSAPNVDVAALATALQQTLAPEIVKALGQKLAQ